MRYRSTQFPRALACASLLSGVVLAAGCSKEAPPQQRPAPQVTVVTVAPHTIPSVPTFVAQTESSQQVDIVARVSGYLDKIAYQEGELIMADGTTYPQRGKINFAAPSFSQDTGSFLVRAVFPNPKRDLRPGMFVTANLHGSVRPDAIVVPQLAVQQGANGHLVYVVKQDGNAEVRPVVMGDYYGKGQIVVDTGLHAGDRVVVDGALRVVPGQPVTIVQAGAAGGEGKPPAEPKAKPPAK